MVVGLLGVALDFRRIRGALGRPPIPRAPAEGNLVGGVAQLPPATMSYTDFVARLRLYCATMGASVTSYGRTAEHNRAVGGVPDSLHLEWLAADIVYDHVPGLDEAQATAASHGLQLLREADHDHVSPLGGPH